MYLIIKTIHQSAALLSISGFILRGIWMLKDSALLHNRLTKILPHIVDTVFLVAGVWLIMLTHQNPLSHGWLAVKLIGLILYILFGTVALKRGRTKRQRLVFFVLAIGTFAFVASVAISKSPLGLFVGF